MASRRALTVGIVVVVAAIALAAAIDALRGGPAPEAGGHAETEPPPGFTSTGAEALMAEVRGTLYYTDESCELRAILLPGQERVEAPDWNECRFVLSPDATGVSAAGTGWDPRADPPAGRLFELEDGLIRVSSDRGPDGEPFRGTAPAWRPDGTLTYFADGAVREWPSGEVVLSQRDLVRAQRRLQIGELSTGFTLFRVREAAWLDERRLAAVVAAEGPDAHRDMLAIYAGRGLDAYTFDAPGGFSDLRTSARGRYVAARSTGGRASDFVMLHSGFGEFVTPRVVGYRSIAWSPDERWAAIAAEGGILLWRPFATRPDFELDLDAQDLTWRG